MLRTIVPLRQPNSPVYFGIGPDWGGSGSSFSSFKATSTPAKPKEDDNNLDRASTSISSKTSVQSPGTEKGNSISLKAPKPNKKEEKYTEEDKQRDRHLSALGFTLGVMTGHPIWGMIIGNAFRKRKPLEDLIDDE